MHSPIILFVYNRPFHTRQTLEALSNNILADESNLIVFADGPKSNTTSDDLSKIIEVRSIVKEKKWCKSVQLIESDINKGLANSIISGVTEVASKYGKCIVLEDDIVTSKGFLSFINQALEFYKNNENVMHISGYMFPHNKKLPETFFFNVPLCWGWGTWDRAWKHLNTNTIDLYEHFEKLKSWKIFNKFGGNYLKSQLDANLTGDLKTWFIKWHASVLINKGYVLYPNKSLVNNIGFDNSGEHCDYSNQFNQEVLADSISVKTIRLKENRKAKKIIIEFYQGKRSWHLREIIKPLIPKKLKLFVQSFSFQVLKVLVPEIKILRRNINWNYLTSGTINLQQQKKLLIYTPYQINSSKIGDYTYIASNSVISMTTIGKFCSIGPNFLCGWGIHPVNGISTSPMFYSTLKQNGMTLSDYNKVEERKQIVIGNDVFIGANVIVLDGVTIGDGAVIGAGAVVSKNIPPYAIAIGSPIQILKFRFTDNQIKNLLEIKWWDFDEEQLKNIEKLFFEIDKFIERYGKV